MSTTNVGFIGAGRVATILLGGWERAGTMPGEVAAFDGNADVVTRLQGRHPAVLAATLAEAAAQPIVFLALHPPTIGETLPQLKAALPADAVLVSLAPKFTMAKLSELLGGFDRIARLIPNAPSIVGKGYNPIAFGDALPEPDRSALRKLFSTLGACVVVAESELEVYAVVTAMAPTFLWPQLEMLASLAESAGLSRHAAWNGIEKMVSGAAVAMRDAGMTAAEVQDLVPVKPVAEEAAAFVQAARPKLEGLLAKLRP